MNTIVICSGGLDSVSLAYRVAHRHELSALLSFDYGQRHRKELDSAASCAARLGVAHQIIDIRTVGAQLTGSALTSDVDVPDGHYAEESMRITIVPNRTMRSCSQLPLALRLQPRQKRSLRPFTAATTSSILIAGWASLTHFR
jgi:7-cyano-7-deazaguanine synthase in queuosine biosynthesis